MIIDYSVLIANALGFSLAFVWNETFMKTIGYYFPESKGSVVKEYLIYALVITTIIILVVSLINFMAKKDDKKASAMGVVKC